MDDDFDDDFEGVQVYAFSPEPVSRRFYKADLLVLGLDLIAGVAGAVSNSLMEARNRAALHANWTFDQDAFHEEAAREIETLIAGEDESGE